MDHKQRIAALIAAFAFSVATLSSQAAEPGRVTGVPLGTARICVTGYDHNRPDDFLCLGDFIGWTSGAVRLANSDLLFVHSAGYWHLSFATPIILTACSFLSTDGGKTWSPPIRIDPSVHGYSKLALLGDESLLLSYVWQHYAPQRCYMVHLNVNSSRDGVELLPMGQLDKSN